MLMSLAPWCDVVTFCDILLKTSRVWVLSHFSCVRLFATLWTVAHQFSLSMGFSRQEYWGRLPCPPSGDLPNSGVELVSPVTPALQADSFFFFFNFNWRLITSQYCSGFAIHWHAGRFFTAEPLGKPPEFITPAYSWENIKLNWGTTYKYVANTFQISKSWKRRTVWEIGGIID